MSGNSTRTHSAVCVLAFFSLGCICPSLQAIPRGVCSALGVYFYPLKPILRRVLLKRATAWPGDINDSTVNKRVRASERDAVSHCYSG